MNERKKILIIDDDSFYAMVISGWLKDAYDTDIASGGMEGIGRLKESGADLVLLDYEMPEIDGPKTLEMLRSNSETSSTPVFFLSGAETEGSIERIMSLKPEGYILKNISRENLLNTICSFFDRQEA